MFQSWFEENYPEMVGYGTWLRGDELNRLSAAEFQSRPFRVLIARLSTAFDTTFSHTHSYLYQLAAGVEGVFADLAFLPPRADLPLFKATPCQVPWWIATQTKRSPLDFDLLAVSNSIAQELLNLPALLERSGVPLLKSARLSRPEVPLVILGGANALYSSVGWGADPWVDGVFVGEDPAAIRRLLELCRDGKARGLGKAEVLRELEAIPGFVQPEAPRATRKSFAPSLQDAEPFRQPLVSTVEDQIGSASLAISEGCPCFCSFCAESWDRKPYREVGRAHALATALAAKARGGLDQIDLFSFNFNLHSDFYGIVWDLLPYFRGIGLKSQRFDLLAHDGQMVELQHLLEKANFTCGLEGISPRLRKYLHKSLEDRDLAAALGAIFKSKAREVKVFLIATGIEQEEDFQAFSEFLETLKKTRQAHHSGARMVFSMTPLVRFPWTPLEFEAAASAEEYGRIIAKTAGRVRAAGFEFREAAELPEYWVSQVLVRAADPRVGEALLAALAKTGFLYYRQIDERFQKELALELAQRGLDEATLFAGFDLEASASKPWARISTGVKREFLWEQYLECREFRDNGYCLGRSWKEARCLHCGACPTRFHVRDIVLAKQSREHGLEQYRQRLTAARKSELEVPLRLRVAPEARGLPRKFLGAALGRALMLTEERCVPGYRGYAGSYWENEKGLAWVVGEERLRLRWSREGLGTLEALLGDAGRLAKVNDLLRGLAELQAADSPAGQLGAVRLVLSAGAPLRPEKYLKERDLKFTLRKEPDGAYRYEFTPQAVKKKLLKTLRVQGGTAWLDAGEKFREEVEDFLKSAVQGSRSSDWVRAVLSCESLPAD